LNSQGTPTVFIVLDFAETHAGGELTCCSFISQRLNSKI